MALVYRIECSDPKNAILKIQEEGSRRILYLDTVQLLAQPVDQEAIAFLAKIHLRSNQAMRCSDPSFQQIFLSLEHWRELIPLLAKTGRFFYQQKRLSWDPSALKLYWKGEKHSEKSASFTAVFQSKNQEIPLSSCSIVFPGCALFQETFFPITSILSWRWVERFLQGTVLLEGTEKKKFLEEMPPLLWKEIPSAPFTVFPQLRLTDATGCFANLWMHYPQVGLVAFEDLAPSISGKTRLKKEEESWEKDLLEAGYLRKIVGGSRYYCPGDRVRETLFFLLDLGWSLFDSKRRAIFRQKECAWSLQEEGGRVAIRGSVRFQEGECSLRKASEAKGLWVELEGNAVGLLDRAAFQIEGEWEGEALCMEKSLLSHAVPLLEKGRIDWSEPLYQMIEDLRQGGLGSPSFPGESFRGALFPYQQKGVDFLSSLHRWGFSALLADEMGLGKTVQVLAFFSRLRTNLPILIVAPSSLLYHWRSEINRFLPEMAVSIYSGANQGSKQTEFSGVLIVSYAQLRLHAPFFSSLAFEVIVLDEANAIKTASTQTAEAVCQLKARFKISLTGTPMENRPDELWSQFRFLMPDLLGDRKQFQSAEYETLRKKMRPFILRRKKGDVEIDLPEKIEQIAWVEMSETQKEVYDQYLGALKGGLLKKIEKDGVSSHRMEILEAILRLRQICCDPRLVGSDVAGTKIDLLLQDVEGRKVLIFSQFTSMLQWIGKALEKEGREYFYLDGSVLPEERADRVRRFQEGEGASIFLLSLKAGGVGLNLTAADYVLLFDPWWNEAVENQAIDRVHRIGQKKSVIARRYLVPNSIEEKMLRLKEEKRNTAELLLEEGLFSWREEDLVHLLS